MQGHDLNELLKKGQGIPGAENVPNLGQQAPPQMSGIMVNGQVWTINELEQLSDADFREFFLGTIIGLMGGHYVSARVVSDLQEAGEEPLFGADSDVGASAEVLKAEDVGDDS